MMVHNQLSGYVHEVPDSHMGPALGEVVYDGLGNPVGWNPFSAIKDAVSGAGNMIRNVIGGAAATLPFNLINQGINSAGQAIGLLPGTPGFVPPPAAPLPYPAPGASMYPYAPPPPYGMPSPYGTPGSFPAGWTQPNLPYTGLGPRRMYMRCAVWPGPQGLVPGHAANMPPGFPGAMPHRFGIRHRRRRR